MSIHTAATVAVTGDLDDEDELIRLAQAGDGAAFGRLYDRYLPSIYRYTYSKTSSRSAAEDLTSETFLRAFRAIARRPRAHLNFAAWLVTIARNVVIDHHRSGWSRLAIVTDEVDPQVDESIGPEQAALASVSEASLRSALTRLPDDQRECLLLRFFAGLSISETAAAMDRTDGAVKQLQFRATNRLRRIIDRVLE
ncbi:sigma-70 family RNA polymerase sigma factor [Kribbella speibonae]|uniref:Sigma-70 family RNA polymerase sigma factor n=1 Tax=Kribbella speibonae TaxID=1572660 RepID=A0A4R0IIA8_9ACTN|nr:sigma-70 family RNA polymerase sigma factor [Kribbella speibonae]TCC24640.1 sigma-70 family RNA polymerase sigma factor [Kribbella speibonae]TCC30946.1 sigma-70 family RNA polymerase sigma factor [Kribbella speibonae]